MTKTMTEVLAEHQLSLVWQDDQETGITCMCGLDVPTEIERNEIDTQWLAAHQAAALSDAGFGLVSDAGAKALEGAAERLAEIATVNRAADLWQVVNGLRGDAAAVRGGS